ncbi:beta-mannosidase [Panacagrimonas perspica]|uniref:beta-mannosidase n=1 Tax=Panacagrimonas perspica TaxID=381431 RepID=A0A4S3KAC5_9GAMM|nr:glycoside hydrolase family 2 protein [Panacagrimonas perspica]TDU32296.1 beta-mannosidase [Panacagrimonas perspica]THD05239.1 hypothetical protein B1810_00320 [Panacagrimonas perspica]
MITWPKGVGGAHVAVELARDWQYTSTPPGAALEPDELDGAVVNWIPAQVPGTAAGALRAAKQWSFDHQTRDFDAEDGWWRVQFDNDPEPSSSLWLRFEGLTTPSEVWLNGTKILESRNQFVAHEVNVTAQLVAGSNVLHLRCGALNTALKAKRARPRWKTRLVASQQLRWHRACLLGRIPGWSPPVAATGPWRAIQLISRRRLRVTSAHLQSSTDGHVGTITARITLGSEGELTVLGARLHVGDCSAPMALAPHESSQDVELTATVTLPDVVLWWPHTHGEQALYQVRVSVDCGTQIIELDWDRTGFRTVAIDRENDGFALRINGVPIFCRGACWTPLDVVTLAGDDAELLRTLDQFREAGFNLLRIGGTMVYESQAFYSACAERGIMVWQDFCFANMDYPFEDAAFRESVREEAHQFLSRTQLNPALAVLCGNSEIEQQVAMLGQGADLWRNPMFDDLLPSIGHELRPDLPYVTSSPTGGALPFQIDKGLSHYYGVGAYMRPLEDARRAGVRFTSECLAFANVPEPETLESFLGDGQVSAQHPRWKTRVPRDSGAGWDFDDVRDHYLSRVFGVDPTRLRYADVERYLYLSRLASSEAMSQAMNEWRRTGSACSGALVWFWRDLWPGAGWGLIDSRGVPKAPYYALKRACSAVCLSLIDEGLNGLDLHATNDRPDAMDVRLTLSLYQYGEVLVAEGSQLATLPARGGLRVGGDQLIGRFTDLTHSYRFGPPGHDVVVATLSAASTDEILGRAFHVPDMGALDRIGDPALSASAVPTRDGGYVVSLESRKFAYGVWLEARGYAASDNYFSLAPGHRHDVILTPRGASARFQAWVHSVNGRTPVRVLVDAPLPADRTGMPSAS